MCIDDLDEPLLPNLDEIEPFTGIDKGIPEKNICCICMISAPQGVEAVLSKYPNITLIVAAVDSHLNERGYIVPGMGDAGDRIYNTL